jgi:hypothetical protein
VLWAIWRKYCDMTPESQNSSLLDNGGKQVPAEMYTHGTKKNYHLNSTARKTQLCNRWSIRKRCFLCGSCRDVISRILWSIGRDTGYPDRGY